MQYLYILCMLMLKKCSQHFKEEFQKKCIYFETKQMRKKTPNTLAIYMLMIIEVYRLESQHFPDFFKQIIEVEGDI